MTFKTWLRTFNSEKELDGETVIKVAGKDGTPNFIPLACVWQAIERAPKHEQKAIKDKIVRIDFVNGDVVKYYAHLAQAIAL